MLVKGGNLIRKGVRNILLIQLGDIGDVVLSFPCIRALRENFPQSNIIVAVREKARELIEDCQWATGVISVNKGRRRFTEELSYQKKFFSCLRKFHFDLSIDLRTGDRGAILAFLSGARQRIGFYAHDGKLWRNRLFTHLNMPEPKPDRHFASYYLDILFSVNMKTNHVWPEHEVPVERQQKAAALFKKENIPSGKTVVAVQPFSLWRYKEWGMRKYATLIKWMTSKFKIPVIITGSADERRRAARIIEICGEKNVYNFAGKTSIGMFAAVLKLCGLFIGGDSAGMHISGAVGTPTVNIFGPSPPISWAPRGDQHCVVSKDMPCVPCRQKGCNDSEKSRCLDELTFEEVRERVDEQMGLILT